MENSINHMTTEEPHFEKTSAVIGDKKNNGFIIPTITGIGIGVLGYFIAERFQKNKFAFSIGGLALGLSVGIFILKNKENGK
jgi:hypothetical protein